MTPSEGERIERVIQRLKSSNRILVLTDAGISRDSGIPTFRGEDGLWKRYRAEDLANPFAFQKNPELVWEWYRWRQGIIKKAKPGHTVIAEMGKFFLAYKNNPKLAQLVREIPWGQNIVILEKLKDDYQREYYLRMAIRNSWSRNILIHQIESKSFERFLTNRKSHNFDKTLPVKMLRKVEPAIKDTYMLDFLEISENIKVSLWYIKYYPTNLLDGLNYNSIIPYDSLRGKGNRKSCPEVKIF